MQDPIRADYEHVLQEINTYEHLLSQYTKILEVKKGYAEDLKSILDSVNGTVHKVVEVSSEPEMAAPAPVKANTVYKARGPVGETRKDLCRKLFDGIKNNVQPFTAQDAANAAGFPHNREAVAAWLRAFVRTGALMEVTPRKRYCAYQWNTKVNRWAVLGENISALNGYISPGVGSFPNT